MIKIITPVTVCFAVASSCWAQEKIEGSDSEESKIVVTASRFQQPVSSVLEPVTVVTREEIDRWQAKTLPDVLGRLPGVDISQYGGLGKFSSVFICGAESRHSLILVDGIRLNQAGISGSSDLSQIPVSMIQRIEYIRGPRSAVYGSDAIGGVINIITGYEKGTRLDAGIGSNSYQSYEASTLQQLTPDTKVGLAGNYIYTKGIDVDAKTEVGKYPQPDKDGFLTKSVWGNVEHQFSEQWRGFFRSYGFNNRSQYDASRNDDGTITNTRKLRSRSYDTGLQFYHENYSSQLVASYGHVVDDDFKNNGIRDRRDTARSF